MSNQNKLRWTDNFVDKNSFKMSLNISFIQQYYVHMYQLKYYVHNVCVI